MAVALTAVDHARVTDAVAAAERGTDGEIVTIVTRRSDDYHDVGLQYAMLAMLLVVAAAAMWPSLLERVVARVARRLGGRGERRRAAACAVRARNGRIPDRAICPRMDAGAARANAEIDQGAAGAAARDCVISGSARNSARRRGSAYSSICRSTNISPRSSPMRASTRRSRRRHGAAAMAALVDEVRAGRPGEGMAAAVGAIGAILAEHFPKTAADTNELPDRLIEL